MASEHAKEGYTKVPNAKDDSHAWVSDAVIVSLDGIKSVYSSFSENGEVELLIRFTEGGAAKMREVTSQHQGKLMAILIDGQLRQTASISSSIEQFAVLNGWTGEEVNDLTHYLYAPR